jgi:hypothetical protein
MLAGIKRGSPRYRCAALIAIAALLLLVQSFAAAHYHQDDPRWGITHNTRAAETDALCAVCAFYLHFSTNPVPVAAPPGAAIVEYRIAIDVADSLPTSLVSRPSSRAPPVSA